MSHICYGQHQERQVLLYNIGLGGLTSGIGSIINTPKGQNWKKNFVRSFWQGCAGGVLHYTGKKTVFLINKNQSLSMAWAAKLQHAAGSSITESAAANRPFLQNWNINVGPVRIDYSFGNRKLNLRFLASSVYTCIAGFSLGTLDAKSSLMTGVLVFKTDKLISGDYAGGTYGTGIVYYNDSGKFHTIAHEYIHSLQYSEYVTFNTWLNPLTSKVGSNKLKNVFQNHIYLDLPYLNLFYWLEGQYSYYYYYRNFYELEAERFATNSYVPVH